MKRIAVVLREKDENNLIWIMESLGCNQTEAVKIALDLIRGNFTPDVVFQHYIMLKKQDLAQKDLSDH